MEALWTYGSAALSGALVALLLALFGGGGSVLATPLLLYIVGVRDPHVAIGTSAAAVAVNAAMGLAGQARGGHVKWPCALLFGGAGIAGALAGAQVAMRIDGQQLLVWFALAMSLVGLSMLRRPRSEGDPDVRIDGTKALRIAPIGLVTGLAAGFFGIGGGFLIVPGLIAATGMTLRHAAAASLVSVTLFGAATSASYAWSGLVDWPVFLALIGGGALGAVAGIRLSPFLAGRAAAARGAFAAMVIATAGYVAWRAIGV